MIFLKIVLLLLSIIKPSVAIVQKEVFRKEDLHSNILCPLANLDFGVFKKMLECAAMCNRVATCRSFFYNKMSQFCKGVPGLISTTFGCHSMPGTAYYKTTDDTFTTSSATSTTTATTSTTTSTTDAPTTTTSLTTTTSTTTTTLTTTTPSTIATLTTTTPTTTAITTPTTTLTTTVLPSLYDNPCSSDSDCPVTYGTCIQGKCSCVAGYRYNPSSESCVINCITYGSTYIEYPQMGIGGASIAEYTSVTVSQCQAYCSALLVCPGFTYTGLISNGRCRLKSETPYTDPSAVIYPPNVYYYTRNCA